MLLQAEAEAPVEACGILAGKNGKVQKFFKMTNADHSSDHFMMVPEEQFKVVKDNRAAGLEMLAIYHSHLATPARPSEEDIRLAIVPDATYAILSLADEEPYIKAFKIDEGAVSKVPVNII